MNNDTPKDDSILGMAESIKALSDEVMAHKPDYSQILLDALNCDFNRIIINGEKP